MALVFAFSRNVAVSLKPTATLLENAKTDFLQKQISFFIVSSQVRKKNILYYLVLDVLTREKNSVLFVMSLSIFWFSCVFLRQNDISADFRISILR